MLSIDDQFLQVFVQQWIDRTCSQPYWDEFADLLVRFMQLINTNPNMLEEEKLYSSTYMCLLQLQHYLQGHEQ